MIFGKLRLLFGQFRAQITLKLSLLLFIRALPMQWREASERASPGSLEEVSPLMFNAPLSHAERETLQLVKFAWGLPLPISRSHCSKIWRKYRRFVLRGYQLCVTVCVYLVEFYLLEWYQHFFNRTIIYLGYLGVIYLDDITRVLNDIVIYLDTIANKI